MHEHVEEHEAHEPFLQRELSLLGEARPRLFDQLVIDHAARARGLAGATIETQLQMFGHRLGRLHDPVRQTAHQLDAPAGRIRLVTGRCISRARRQTQPAVHAGESAAIRSWIQLDRRFSATR